MKKYKIKSVRSELLNSSLVFTMIITIFFSLSFIPWLYKKELSNTYHVLEQRNKSLNTFIDGYFTEIRNTINVLSKNSDIAIGPILDLEHKNGVLNLYRDISETNKNIRYIYSGYNNGQLLINDYVTPEGFDPVKRPWYQAPLKNKNSITIGTPYQDIIDKEWLIATGKFLFSEKSDIEGVVSIDSSISDIITILQEKVSEYNTSYSFVTKTNGEVIMHPNEEYIKQIATDFSNKVFPLTSLSGRLEYKLNGIEKISYYSYLDTTDWFIVTTINKNEIIDPIIRDLILYIVTFTLFIIMVGLIQSLSLSRRFSTPLIELKSRVGKIIKGDTVFNSSYKYPNNEIGTIAREIGSLAEKEIYNRALKLTDLNSELELRNKELLELSITDQLTQLYNRRKIEIEFQSECHRSIRYNRPFSVILFDIDRFKEINDSYSHQVGDSVLIEVSKIFQDKLRETDFAGRWGGEEFLILCPETNLEGCIDLAKKISKIIEKHIFINRISVTLSAGCSEFIKTESHEELFRRVDENLYIAKDSGRNTIVGS